MKHYSRIWYGNRIDLCIDLFETKLKSLLFYKLNCSIKDIKYFDSYLKYYWIHLSIRFTVDRYVLISSRLHLYQKVVNYFANSMNNNNNSRTSSDIKKMNDINPKLNHVFGCSKRKQSPLSLLSLKDADMLVGIDSIVNQTSESNSFIENSDNNDNDHNHRNCNSNPSSNNIDSLSKPPNKAGSKTSVHSPPLRTHDDLDIKLKNVLVDDNDGDISATHLEIDSNEMDSSDIGTDVESLTSQTEGNQLTQANVSILQSLLLSPKMNQNQCHLIYIKVYQVHIKHFKLQIVKQNQKRYNFDQ